MKHLCNEGNNLASPNTITYTAVINEFASENSEDFKKETRAIAMQTSEELENSPTPRPNRITYASFVKACVNFLIVGNTIDEKI